MAGSRWPSCSTETICSSWRCCSGWRVGGDFGNFNSLSQSWKSLPVHNIDVKAKEYIELVANNTKFYDDMCIRLKAKARSKRLNNFMLHK